MGSGNGEKPVFSFQEHIKTLLLSPPTRKDDITVGYIARFVHVALFALTLIASTNTIHNLVGLHVFVAIIAIANGCYAMFSMKKEWKIHKKHVKKWLKSNFTFPLPSTLGETKTHREKWGFGIKFSYILLALFVFFKDENGGLVLMCGVFTVITIEMYNMSLDLCERFHTNQDAIYQIIASHYIKRGQITRVFIPAKKHTRVIYYPAQK